MGSDNRIDYGLIQSDYAYFMAHTNETAIQRPLLLAHMKWLHDRPSPQCFLDFGCGTGKITEEILAQSQFSKDENSTLEISLIEPVAEHLAESIARLGRFAKHVEPLDASLNYGLIANMDLILANHSLYYVPDIWATLQYLLSALKPGGRLIVTLLDKANELAKIWQSAYLLIGKPFPFVLAEDVQSVFQQNGLASQRDSIAYEIELPDSAEARLRILRFLIGPALKELPLQEASSLFDRYCINGTIKIATTYPQLTVSRGTV